MTRRATFTKAELARTIKAADEAGKDVLIYGGMIRIVAPTGTMPVPSPEGDEEKCDEAFGVSD